MNQMQMCVSIPRKITNELLHFAQISPEREICGLISSIDDQPFRCYPIENCDQKPETRFQLDPKQQISAMTQMRQNGEELYAIYHSHPRTPAVPSTIDLEMSSYPEALTLIISLNTKGVLEMRGYRIINQQATEIKLTIT